MRAPLSWLRDFAPFPDDIRELTAALDDLGLVVEEVEHIGAGLESVVVSQVNEITAIEGADKIRRVVVEAGDGPLEIVCGASNFKVGDRVPLAPVGAVLPRWLRDRPPQNARGRIERDVVLRDGARPLR